MTTQPPTCIDVISTFDSGRWSPTIVAGDAIPEPAAPCDIAAPKCECGVSMAAATARFLARTPRRHVVWMLSCPRSGKAKSRFRKETNSPEWAYGKAPMGALDSPAEPCVASSSLPAERLHTGGGKPAWSATLLRWARASRHKGVAALPRQRRHTGCDPSSLSDFLQVPAAPCTHPSAAAEAPSSAAAAAASFAAASPSSISSSDDVSMPSICVRKNSCCCRIAAIAASCLAFISARRASASSCGDGASSAADDAPGGPPS
mmetsp:Transcript_11509/g.48276  ORF Transcript_11509/g.48276 Transcript_11509/m.48276 type:complete len:261 (+) Transcript_11509:2072-2854(+)